MEHLSPALDAPNTGLLVQPAAIHAAFEGIVTVDPQQRIAMVNPAAERMFGRSAAELLGRDMSVLMPERHRDAHAAHLQRFMASEAAELWPAPAGRSVGLRASGEEFPLEIALCKTQDATGRPCCTALLCDRSEERHLGTVVVQLNQRMRAIFDVLPVAIWITEGETVVYANDACSQLFGVDPEARFTGQSVFGFLSPRSHERVRGTITEALARQDAVLTLEGEIARADGSERQVEMVVAALPDHERTLVQLVISDVAQQSQERRELLHSRRTLRELSANLIEVREEERRCIARELHDELGQRLTALKLELAALGMAGDASARQDRIRGMIEMVDDTVAAARRIAMDLRPPMLDDLGLNAAIEWQAREFERHSGLHLTLRLAPTQDRIDARTATALYRIVQEALTNIVRHARASRADIAITLSATSVELTVLDDGDGFSDVPPKSPRGSFGLIGIRERVLLLGGVLDLSNLPHGGAKLVVNLPLVLAHEARPPSPDALQPAD